MQVRIIGNQSGGIPPGRLDLDDGYRVLSVAPVIVTLPAYTFLVVDDYPDNWPPRIVNEALARVIEDGLRLDRVAISSHDFGFEDPPFATLVCALSYPIPTMTLACDLTLSIGESVHCTYTLVDRGGGQIGVTATSRTEVWYAVRQTIDDGAYRSLEVHFRLDDERAGSLQPGQSVLVVLKASPSAALSDPYASDYLELNIERRATLE